MKELTARELKILNNVSRVLSPSVSLGVLLQNLIDSVVTKGTPINGAAAYGTLTISGVVVNGETVKIDNPLDKGVDIYEFVVDAEAEEGNIPVDISKFALAAASEFTVDVQPTAADTFTIGTTTYKFVAINSAENPGDISVGTTLAEAQEAIVAAVNGTDGLNEPHPLVTISDFDTDVAVITAKTKGSAGNAIATTETLTAVTNLFEDSTLLLGADCTNANAALTLTDAVNEFDTQGISAEVTSVGVVKLVSNLGAAGNNISTTETMTNGAFGADKMAGGVTGTPSLEGALMVDNSYLYVAIAENTNLTNNWRRISIGSAF